MTSPNGERTDGRPVVRFLRSLARGLGGIFLPAPSVSPDQRVKASFGFRTRGPRRSQGWLILTKNGRLIFERAVPWFSIARIFPSPNIAVAVRDVVAVQRLPSDVFDVEPVILPVLSITLGSGGQLSVQLLDTNDWLEALGEAIALNAVKRTRDAPTQC